MDLFIDSELVVMLVLGVYLILTERNFQPMTMYLLKDDKIRTHIFDFTAFLDVAISYLNLASLIW